MSEDEESAILEEAEEITEGAPLRPTVTGALLLTLQKLLAHPFLIVLSMGLLLGTQLWTIFLHGVLYAAVGLGVYEAIAGYQPTWRTLWDGTGEQSRRIWKFCILWIVCFIVLSNIMKDYIMVTVRYEHVKRVFDLIILLGMPAILWAESIRFRTSLTAVFRQIRHAFPIFLLSLFLIWVLPLLAMWGLFAIDGKTATHHLFRDGYDQLYKSAYLEGIQIWGWLISLGALLAWQLGKERAFPASSIVYRHNLNIGKRLLAWVMLLVVMLLPLVGWIGWHTYHQTPVQTERTLLQPIERFIDHQHDYLAFTSENTLLSDDCKLEIGSLFANHCQSQLPCLTTGSYSEATVVSVGNNGQIAAGHCNRYRYGSSLYVWGTADNVRIGFPTNILSDNFVVSVAQSAPVIAYVLDSGEIAVGDPNTFDSHKTYAVSEISEQIVTLALSADGSRLAYIDENRRAAVLDAATGAKLFDLSTPEQPVYQVAFTPDGQKIVLTRFGNVDILADDGTHLHTFENDRSISPGHGQMQPTRFSADSRYVIVHTSFFSILVEYIIFDLVSYEPVTGLAANSVAISPDNQHIAFAVRGRGTDPFYANDADKYSRIEVYDFDKFLALQLD